MCAHGPFLSRIDTFDSSRRLFLPQHPVRRPVFLFRSPRCGERAASSSPASRSRALSRTLPSASRPVRLRAAAPVRSRRIRRPSGIRRRHSRFSRKPRGAVPWYPQLADTDGGSASPPLHPDAAARPLAQQEVAAPGFPIRDPARLVARLGPSRRARRRASPGRATCRHHEFLPAALWRAIRERR